MAYALASVWETITYVVTYWSQRLLGWWRSMPPKNFWRKKLKDATVWEDWESAARQLNKLFGFEDWRQTEACGDYSHTFIRERMQRLRSTRANPNLHHGLPNLIETGMERNLGNIVLLQLYNRTFTGTKVLIEEYIRQVTLAIDTIANMSITTAIDSYTGPVPPICARYYKANPETIDGKPVYGPDRPPHLPYTISAPTQPPRSTMTLQRKFDMFHSMRRSYGGTCLALKGGSMFGMCHLGVVKALYLQGLLPQVIAGTATGALIAALVAVHKDGELPGVFSGERINLSAFEKAASTGHGDSSGGSRWKTLWRRVKRLVKKGYVLDMSVLEQCVRDNVGDLTFQEAHNRTGRVLNITVSTAAQDGIPTVLNYLNAPHVLIWTAATASNADFPSLYGRPTQLLCKRHDGRIEPLDASESITFQHYAQEVYEDTDRNSPLNQIRRKFNINNFIVSQARPYAVPFLRPDKYDPTMPRGWLYDIMCRCAYAAAYEIRFRLRQANRFGLLPTSIRRFLVDDRIPGGKGITLVPEVGPGDFVRLLETPTRASLDYWVLVGERSVWPAMSVVRARCAIEMKLEEVYARVRLQAKRNGQDV